MTDAAASGRAVPDTQEGAGIMVTIGGYSYPNDGYEEDYLPDAPPIVELLQPSKCCPSCGSPRPDAIALRCGYCEAYPGVRWDGWPLCPSCGEDELWSEWQPEPPDYLGTLEQYLAAPLHCYRCQWSGTLQPS